MKKPKNNARVNMEDIHAFLERSLIDAYLKGKGYAPEDLKGLPEEAARQLKKEASIYASNKLAEVELKAHFVKELQDAFSED